MSAAVELVQHFTVVAQEYRERPNHAILALSAMVLGLAIFAVASMALGACALFITACGLGSDDDSKSPPTAPLARKYPVIKRT